MRGWLEKSFTSLTTRDELTHARLDFHPHHDRARRGIRADLGRALERARPRKPTPEKLAPYECGMPAVGDARERQSVKFYLVAMIFLLFDIEVAFLYPWAMALRDRGWGGSSRSCCSWSSCS